MVDDPRQPPKTENVIDSDVFRGIVAIVVSTLCALPLFVPAALSQRLRLDLGVSSGELGLIFGLFFFVSSLASWPGGRLVERTGASLGMRLGLLVAAISLIATANARSTLWLAVSVGAAGIGQALAQPASNSYLVSSVGARVLGKAFGFKQSAVPFATLVAGLAVPAATFLVNWRILLLVAGVATLLVATGWTFRAGLRSGKPPRGMVPSVTGGASLLLILAVTGGLGGASATALATFFVDAAVMSGIGESEAGVILAVASLLGVVARIGLGTLADRRRGLDRLRTISLLLMLGVAGFALLAVGSPVAVSAGVVIGYVLGWSWPGLLHLVVATYRGSSPARSTGALQVGIGFGSGAGPLLFGQLVERASYAVAWRVMGLCALAAAVAAWGARKRLSSVMRNLVA